MNCAESLYLSDYMVDGDAGWVTKADIVKEIETSYAADRGNSKPFHMLTAMEKQARRKQVEACYERDSRIPYADMIADWLKKQREAE